MNYDCVLSDCALIRIGVEAQIAPRVRIPIATHPLDAATRRSELEIAVPATMGGGVWLGAGAMLPPGVSIGENAVIGAGAAVTKTLPRNVLAVGNPARVMRSPDSDSS